MLLNSVDRHEDTLTNLARVVDGKDEDLVETVSRKLRVLKASATSRPTRKAEVVHAYLFVKVTGDGRRGGGGGSDIQTEMLNFDRATGRAIHTVTCFLLRSIRILVGFEMKTSRQL